MKIKVILLLILLALTPSLFGSVISKNKISKNRYFIQIAVLKNVSNINNVKKRLSSYDLFIQDYKNFKKIYVVNIKNRSELSNIKKIYPTAFIARKPKNITQNIGKTETSNLNKIDNGLFEIYTDSTVPISDIPDAVVIKADNIEEKSVDISERKNIQNDKKLSDTKYNGLNLDLDSILNEKPKGSDLDSSTILKTRKSFL